MGFSIILRHAAAGARAAGGIFRQGRRNVHFASLRPLTIRGTLPPVKSSDLHSFRAVSRFSSSIQKKQAVDAELLRIVESEIKCAQEECGEVEIPEGFPFKIQDCKGTNSITLRRDYHGENIEVIVSMPTLGELDNNEEVGKEEDGGDDEDGGDNDEVDGDGDKAVQPTFPLTVNISKGEKGHNFEIRCTAYAEEIVIDSLFIHGNKDSDDLLAYEGPDFVDLDENLQKAFHKYLEIRGISPATASFLYEYLINKDDREYLVWLQNVKDFLGKGK